MSIKSILSATALVCLTGCIPALSGDDYLSLNEPGMVRSFADLPAEAPEGSCWTVDTVRLASPAHDASTTGEVINAAKIDEPLAEDRQEIWFETPCEEDLTPDFVASLQRALAARGGYDAPITGTMDTATRDAIRAYQTAQGLDSATLSLAAAQQLGLIAMDRGTAI